MRTTYPVRNTDPGTSHEAAQRAVLRRPRVRDAVMTIIASKGRQGITHDRLIAAYHHAALESPGWPPASASSIRTRCSELVTEGLVERVPDVVDRSALGNRSHLWRAVLPETVQ